ncbi:unnamed protein product [Arctogadus glacialis]
MNIIDDDLARQLGSNNFFCPVRFPSMALDGRPYEDSHHQKAHQGRISRPRGRPPRPPPLLDPSDDDSEADNVSSRDPSSDEGDVIPGAEDEGMEVSDEY